MAAIFDMAIATSMNGATERLELSGPWQFALGGAEPAFPQGALPAGLTFDDAVTLPGTTETNGKGPENPARETGGLTRVRKFEGAAWFRREVEIPAAWAGRRIELRLERTKYAQVWWDDALAGEQRLFTAPQHYDLTALAKPGRHRITVMVDNRVERQPFTPNVHQFNSDHTQTNWNGILGRIELVAQPATWIDDVRIAPDVTARAFRISVALKQLAAKCVDAKVAVSAESFNHDGAPQRVPEVVGHAVVESMAGGRVELTLPLGAGAFLWDEFSPALYRVAVVLETAHGRDERMIEAGLREFRASGTQFAINGRTTFLRGRNECGTFPLTGHPPMDVEGWVAYLRINRDYGLNQVRCHTWTPPEAAFLAANRLGLYLQPELPFWGTFDAGVRDFLMPEAEALLRAYGNNPSFVMLTLANEAEGDRALMDAMVARLREIDGRHLYADGCNNWLADPRRQPASDFWVTAKTRTPAGGERPLPVRGSFYFGDGYEGVLQWGEAQTRGDLAKGIAGLPVPVVAHETGQFTVYPDFRDIKKYTGVTRARNHEHFREALARQGRLEQAHDFFRASGALTAGLYREEIELALRTAGFGGFQLLDLQDYPGQGTALVGVLNAFMESKGLVTPERWREFCAPVVPLARFDRYTWTTGETYAADIEVAQYGREDLRTARVTWQVVDERGAVVARGELPGGTIAQGGLRKLGRVEASLAKLAAPARYDLTVTIAAEAGPWSNRWPLWVYPEKVAMPRDASVTVVRAFDARAKALLAEGKRVVLMPDAAGRGYTVRGAYATDFWCWPMFGSSPGTMGLLIDPQHPALAQFPTAFHSERQWSRIAHASAPVVLAGAPAELRPIVQVIDNLARNELIGLVFEAKVGAGSLLVIACDLDTLADAPEARQLRASLLAYAASAGFAPKQEIAVDVLDLVLRPSLAVGKPVTASSGFVPAVGPVPAPEHAVDGDINTRWQVAEGDAAPTLTVDLGERCIVDAIELLWEHDEAGYRYRVEASCDGAAWTMLSDQRGNRIAGGRHTLRVASCELRQLRVTIDGWPAGRKAALRDLRVLGAVKCG